MYERVFVLEVDGVTTDLVKENIERFPNFGRLIREGAWGVMKGPLQPLAPVSIPTLLTGRNPGKLGLYDYFSLPTDSYERQPIAADCIAGGTFIDQLQSAGLKVGLINVPHFHRSSIDGFVVPAEDGSTEFRPIPPEIEESLRATGYRAAFAASYAPGREREFYRHAIDYFDTHVRTALALFSERQWQFGMLSGHFLGEIWHSLWNLSDRRHPRYQDPARSLGGIEPILDSIGEIDKRLPELERLVGDRGLFMIVGRYGHQIEHTKVHLNSVLAKHGYLRFRRSPLSVARRLAFGLGISSTRVEQWAHRLDIYKHFHYKLPRSSRNAVTGSVFLSFADIDWRRTRAVAMGYLGQIYLNESGKRPLGTIAPENLASERDDLVRILEDLRDPRTGSTVVKRVWRADELYSGPRVAEAPDLVIEFNEGYSGQPAFASTRVFTPSPPDHTSEHINESVFFASGPGVRPGRIAPRMEDIAPTILRAFSLAPDDDVDGSVLPIFS